MILKLTLLSFIAGILLWANWEEVTDTEYRAWRVFLDDAPEKNQIQAQEKAEFTALIDAMTSAVVNHLAQSTQ